jgi:hypothetical protein
MSVDKQDKREEPSVVDRRDKWNAETRGMQDLWHARPVACRDPWHARPVACKTHAMQGECAGA